MTTVMVVALAGSALALAAPIAPASAACAWALQSPPVVPSENVSLDAVAAISPSDVWVVGEQSFNGGSVQTMILHWDGTSWVPVVHPTAGVSGGLSDISASGPNDVWAVGSYTPSVGTGSVALTLHYDGATWTKVDDPAESIPGTNLLGIDTGAGKALAVGVITSGSTEATLAMRWDGTTWRIQPSVTPDDASVLSDVSRVAWNDAWAVGQHGSVGEPDTLVEHWDGKIWSVVPSPSPGGGSRLDAIARVPGSDVEWAVGSWHSGPNADTALLLRWTGTSWVRVPAPATSVPSVSLLGVAAVSRRQVWAVGNRILQWDGSIWKNMPMPQAGGTLVDVDVVPRSAHVWATGFSVSSQGEVVRRC